MILVTGGAGFMGANFVLGWFSNPATAHEGVINLDALTYAGNTESLSTLADQPLHKFVHGNIGAQALVKQLLTTHKPRAIVNFAAESHVDRSIHGPADFIQTNIQGTFNLLECARAYWQDLAPEQVKEFRFLHESREMPIHN